jgi:glycosyltransferase involved in cell wall biosynthesis
LPGALNAGFALAKGDYHTWLQDDNHFQPQALAVMVAQLEARPDADLVYSAYEEVDEISGERRLQPVLPPDYLAEKCVVTPSFLYRRHVYEQLGGYRVAYYLAEDYDFWLRAYGRFRFIPLPDALHVYYFHPDSLTESARRLDIDDAASRALLWALEHEPWTRRKRQRARIYRYLASMAARRGDGRAARRYYGRALLHDPALIIRRVLRRQWRRWRINRQS